MGFCVLLAILKENSNCKQFSLAVYSLFVCVFTDGQCSAVGYSDTWGKILREQNVLFLYFSITEMLPSFDVIFHRSSDVSNKK